MLRVSCLFTCVYDGATTPLCAETGGRVYSAEAL